MTNLKRLTIGAAAISLMVGVSATAMAGDSTTHTSPSSDFVFGKVYQEEVNNNWDNTVTVDIGVDIKLAKYLLYAGAVGIYGAIYTDSAAIATVDNKQISDGNLSISTQDRNDASIWWILNASGNFQGNVASGNLNQQDNVAAIAETASATYGGYAQGSAEAGVYEVQKLWQSNVVASDGVFWRYGNYDYFDNTSVIADIYDGSGNFQGNVAAGNLNQQKNALAIAVAANSALSEATSAVIQEIHASAVLSGVQNESSINNVHNYSGNFQGNAASGNLNQQTNVLSIATFAGS